MDSKIQFSVNLVFKRRRQTKKVRTECSTLDAMTIPPSPTFDFETGVRISNAKLKIYPESPEHSIYLMQKMRIGNSECLTFFNSGANTHLIDGKMARKENLQRISENHSAVGVIGGGTITSESGNFRFNLGLEKDGISHEIRAMKSVTSEFGEYGLEEVAKVFVSSASELEKEYILPKMAGGSKVNLLLGVKNTRIQPTLLQVLSSGIGVYLSSFKIQKCMGI